MVSTQLRSCFVASSGLPAANTSIVADFKGLYDITAAKLGKDEYHRLPSVDASWLPQTPSSQTHILGSSVKNISLSCSEVSNRSKGTEGLMEMGQTWGPKRTRQRQEGDWEAKLSSHPFTQTQRQALGCCVQEELIFTRTISHGGA